MIIESVCPPEVLQWKPLCEKYAALHPILIPDEIQSVIWSESHGKLNAYNPNDPSWGLMGVEMPIARAFGGITDHNQLFDPDNNVRAGSAFLAHLKTAWAERFPITNTNNAWIAAYNEGETQLLKGACDPAYISAFVQHLNVLGVKVA